MFGICSTIRKRAKITLDTIVETTILDPHCILNVNNINLEVSAIKNCEKNGASWNKEASYFDRIKMTEK